jgi:O-acetylhomoserine (thiol)-lyase
VKGFTTKAIHGAAVKKDPHGSLRFPVYDSAAFEYESAQDIQAAFEGKKPSHSYSRITNPTVEAFEQKVRLLSDARGVVAVSSGMAAISNLMLAIAESGSNILTTKFLFGNTHSLFEKTLKPWGLNVRYNDMDDMKDLAASIDKKTRAIFVETITNPQLQVPDIKAIAEVAIENGVPLIADSTLTTPYLFRSKDFGVDVEVLSSTKYISGGATTVGGLIIDNGSFKWEKCPRLAESAKMNGPFALIAKLKREVYRNLGACLSPHNAYMQTLGLETMELRIDKNCRNTMLIAEYLEKHEKIKYVNYPGLRNSRYHETAWKQFGGKFGGILTFELENRERCFAFMDRLRLIKRATNLNDNKTLILHPASTIFCEYSPQEREDMGVPDSMLRLAVGIEDVEDILEDINYGLEILK